MKSISIDTVELILSNPIAFESEWIGQMEPMRQLMACWFTIADSDLPLTPRIIGVPGIGKTTLALAAARRRGQDVYIMQCTSDTRPEDLLITPVLSEKGKISYHASPLLSAAITGSIAVLDEGNRMSEKSWASLAGLLDNRRIVESVVAGITIKAHRDFRAVVTMNDDASTYEIPDYIMSRLQPGISVGFPDRSDEMKILSYNLPFGDEAILNKCVDFLQKAHGLDLPYSVRDGINAVRYALKQKAMDRSVDSDGLLHDAIKQILGDEALDLDGLAAKRNLSGQRLPDMHLGDYFFPDGDLLNPDRQPD
jgi:MoxR-like ATPase